MIEELRIKWDDVGNLTSYLLTVSARQLELAELIASEESNLNSAFVNEREEMYKGTDSLAKAKAKSLVGSNKTRYEYEFEALTNLIQIITSRISQLQALQQANPAPQ